jgi:alpha-beta hydrolase superfamily lysophospholipase
VQVLAFEGLRHDLFHESRSAEVVSAVADWLETKLPR